MSAQHITIMEVGPRDGLQNSKGVVPTEAKVRYIEMLVDSGLRNIETTSFVSPRWVPQMYDASEVMAQLHRRDNVNYVCLTPNETGAKRALKANVSHIAIFTAASDTFNRKNTNIGVEDSLVRYRALIEYGREQNPKLRVRGYISTAFGCPYEGEVSTARVVDIATRLIAAGCEEVSIGDTIGIGTPRQVREITSALLSELPNEQVAMHFHDTRGTALANSLAAMELGIHRLDASSGGLGGCPYAPGASGNLATEDLVYMLNGMGVSCGVDITKLARASRFIGTVLGRPMPSKFLQTCPEELEVAPEPHDH